MEKGIDSAKERDYNGECVKPIKVVGNKKAVWRESNESDKRKCVGIDWKYPNVKAERLYEKDGD
jgi:hypothetical protein